MAIVYSWAPPPPPPLAGGSRTPSTTTTPIFWCAESKKTRFRPLQGLLGCQKMCFAPPPLQHLATLGISLTLCLSIK